MNLHFNPYKFNMKISFASKLILALFIAIGIASCSDNKPHFTVEGVISNADSSMLYFSKRTLSETTVVDSVRLGKDGTFKFEQPAPDAPEYYLLTMDGLGINLAIDSIETVKINSDKKTFATEYSVEGSEPTLQIKEVVLAQYQLSQYIYDMQLKLAKKEIKEGEFAEATLKAIQDYKDLAFKVIISDQSGLAGYFAVFQKVGGLLIFDPADKKDIKAFQAVATRWTNIKSARSEHITNFTLSALNDIRQAKKTEETLSELLSKEENAIATKDYYDFSLPNVNNEDVKLSSLRGKVVLLDFTTYQAENSPAHNAELNKIYERFKASGLTIYQVTFDTDAHAWKNAAINLPWTCVRDPKGSASSLISKFNIFNLPTVYLIDKEGNLVKRILPEDNIVNEIQKII